MRRSSTAHGVTRFRELLVKLTSEARVERWEAVARGKLEALPIVRVLITRLALWDAESTPKIVGDSVVWRSKHGPRKHALKPMDRRLAGLRSWRANRERSSVMLVGAEEVAEYFGESASCQPMGIEDARKQICASEPEILVIGISALGHASSEILIDEARTAGLVVFLWARRESDADLVGRVSGVVRSEVPVFCEAPSVAARFEAIGWRLAVAIGPALEPALPQRNVDCVEMRDLKTVPRPKFLTLQDGPEQGSGSLALIASALQEGAVLGHGARDPLAVDLLSGAPWFLLPQAGHEVEATSELELAQYAHRSERFARSALSRRGALRRLCFHAGLPPPREPWPAVTVICVSNRPARFTGVIDTFRSFVYPNKKLIFVANGEPPSAEEVDSLLGNVLDVVLLRMPETMSLGESLNRARMLVETELWSKMDDDDHYGEKYLSDAVEALVLSGADIVGKGAYFTFLPGPGELYFKAEQPVHAFSDRFVHGGTILARNESTRDIPFRPVVRGTDSLFLQECKLKGLSVYSSDPFNFAYIRYDAAGHHTFDVSTQEILKGASRVAVDADVKVVDV